MSGTVDQRVGLASSVGEPLELKLRPAFDGPLGELLRSWVHRDANAARLSAKFRLYYRLRPYIPIFARQWMQQQRNGTLEVPSDWYFPTVFCDELKTCLATEQLDRPVLHPWPDAHEMCSVLTHDIETQEGLALVPGLAAIEESLGFRSVWYLIPHKYSIDRGLVDDLLARGHEVGIHGFNHDGRLFESRRMFNSRVPAINAACQRYRATGFRSPMVHRNLDWMQAFDIDYDASTFDVDPFQAMPGGVGGVWPFFAGKFVELPYTLPQDHTLLISLQQKDCQVWIDKFRWLRGLAGMAMLVTHPDYLDTPGRRDIYRAYLEFLAGESSVWQTLPRDVVRWWRQRDSLELVWENDSSSRLVGPGAERARLLGLGQVFQQYLDSEMSESSQ